MVETHASTPASTGPVQGAAITPATRPMPKAGRKPAPRTDERRCLRPCGRSSSKAPNIEAARANIITAMPTETHQSESAEPNALPESAAVTPRIE